MLALARQGSGEGTWLRAERQTRGRGREGRAWVSPKGNLYASTLVRLRPGDPAAPSLSLVAGVSLAAIVGDLILAGRMVMPQYIQAGREDPRPSPGRSDPDRGVSLKWPNDLLVRKAKIAGILLERADDAVVVGIGVNIVSHPDDVGRDTTSLAREGVQIEPEALLRDLAAGFAGLVDLWRRDGLAPIRRAWLAKAHVVGTPLSVRLPDGTALTGLFDGLDPDGALILRLAGGERRVIHAADVFLV